MSIIRATAVFNATSALPEDVITNTFHFDAGLTNEPQLTNMLDLLEDFYTVPVDTTAITGYMGADAVNGTLTIYLYNLDHTPPRAPIAFRVVTFSPVASAVLPTEVALVVSFQAAPQSGVPQARRRGRIYLGGLVASTNASGRPQAAFRAQVLAQANELLAASDASINVDWVVWSPTTSTAVGVANGWIDDAWDTQRRRGVSPTTRTTFDGT